MKKAEFYINIIGGKDIKEYPKVNGWTEEIEDSKGNKVAVGYNKLNQSWVATELTTGFKCNRVFCRTRVECVEDVHNNIDVITDRIKSIFKDVDYVAEYIKPFTEFVENTYSKIQN